MVGAGGGKGDNILLRREIHELLPCRPRAPVWGKIWIITEKIQRKGMNMQSLTFRAGLFLISQANVLRAFSKFLFLPLSTHRIKKQAEDLAPRAPPQHRKLPTCMYDSRVARVWSSKAEGAHDSQTQGKPGLFWPQVMREKRKETEERDVKYKICEAAPRGWG